MDEGIEVFTKQTAGNLQTILQRSTKKPLIVTSSAIGSSNPELQAAKKAQIKIWHRSDLLSTLIQEQPSIVVAGSHGKTTTSTFISTLLALTNQDPTAVVGGVIPYFNSNAHAGQGRFLVAEADESDGSLIKFKAKLGLITNIELDHTDHYPNLEALIETMQIFAKNCEVLLANYDSSVIKKHIKASISWSTKTSEGVDFAALPISVSGSKTIAKVYENGHLTGSIKLPMPGIHNLNNTIAAISVCRVSGMPFKKLQQAVSLLKSPERRFDFRGTWKGRHIVDDYAHHPTEVNATISMARLIVATGETLLPSHPKRLVVAFQPHRYSRTAQFIEEFAIELSKADCVLIAPIYSAQEEPIKGINNKTLASSIRKYNSKIPIYTTSSLDELTALIETNTNIDDLIITMGAGNINRIWDKLREKASAFKMQKSMDR